MAKYILFEKNSGTNEVTKPIQEAQAGHQVKKMPFPLYTQSESIADPIKRDIKCHKSEGDVLRWRSG